MPNDNEKYFLLVNAITEERELLSYNSVLVEIEKEEGSDTDTDTDSHTDSHSDSDSKGENKPNGLPGWALALIIVLGVLLLLALGFIIFRCVMKRKGNVVEEDGNQKLMSLHD